MAQPIYIPAHVKQAIVRHIENAAASAVAAYGSAEEEEDALTGQFGFALRARDRLEDGWTWSLEYTKFRGRGPGAAEKSIGADGILEMRVHTIEGEQRKAALFQAKNAWNRDGKLLEQALTLSNWREAAFVLNFTSTAIEAFSVDDVVRSRGIRSAAGPSQSFTDFIADAFFPCTVGNPDLVYDRERKVLIWLAEAGERVGVPFRVRSRIRLNVNEWRPLPRMIQSNEIPEYRMFADPNDILGVSSAPSPGEVRKARKTLALTYHPDQFHDLDALHREIAKRRMQEVNEAIERVKKK
jgi:hypothetical protein